MTAHVASGASPLTPEQARLIQIGLPMLMQCANEIAARYRGLVEARELLAPGHFALREAAICYDADKHPNFSVYARHHLRGRMIDAVCAEHFSRRARIERAMDRAYETLEAHQEIDADLFADEEAKILGAARVGGDQVLAAALVTADVEARRQSPEDHLLASIDLRGALEALFPHEREAVRLVCEEGMTFDEVAEELHVSARTAQRRYAKGIDKLRALFMEQGEEPPEELGPG